MRNARTQGTLHKKVISTISALGNSMGQLMMMALMARLRLLPSSLGDRTKQRDHDDNGCRLKFMSESFICPPDAEPRDACESIRIIKSLLYRGLLRGLFVDFIVSLNYLRNTDWNGPLNWVFSPSGRQNDGLEK